MVAKTGIRLLGPFQVLNDGAPVDDAAHGSAARLLAALALHPDRPAEREHLAQLFWPDSAGPQARANLRSAIHGLRRSLPGVDRWLALDGPVLRWHPESEVDVDAARFRAAVNAGTARSLPIALDLYRGELLQGWKDEWLQTERADLRRVFVGALRRLADLNEAAGAYGEAASLAERLHADDPLNEAHVRRLMRLHALLGDRAGVQAAYRAATALLRRELDTDPAGPTTDLYRRLTATPQRSADGPGAKRQGSARSSAEPARVGDAVEDLETRLFVGRHEELEVFRRWLTAAGSTRRVLDVSGPGGVGKSTLLRAFARQARQLGWPTVEVDAREIPRTPEGFAAALGTSSEGRAVLRLNRLRPLLLLDTCEELGELDRYLREQFLPRLDPRVRLATAGRYPLGAAWRLDSPWRRLVHSIPVKGFNDEETVAYLRGRGIADPELLAQLRWATGGNPLALSLAADLVLQMDLPDLRAGAARWHLTVHDLVHQLLREVGDEDLRTLLEAAAVVRSFDQRLLADVAGSEMARASFDALARLSVVRPAVHGLSLHDDVRRLIAADLNWRDPARFTQLRLRALGHLHGRMEAAPGPEARAWAFNEQLFLCGNAVIQSLMFGEAEPGRIWVEEGRPEDHAALRQIWRQWLGEHTGAAATEPLRRALESALRWPGTRLRVARGREGSLLGFGAVLPICQESLPVLLTSPNTAAVLRARWTDRQLAGLPRSPARTRRYFLRYLCYGDREGEAVRAALVRDMMPVLSLSGTYLTSVAEPEVQALVAALGFRRLPGPGCTLEGARMPEFGCELDLTRIAFADWIHGVMTRATPRPLAPELQGAIR